MQQPKGGQFIDLQNCTNNRKIPVYYPIEYN